MFMPDASPASLSGNNLSALESTAEARSIIVLAYQAALELRW